MTIPYNVFFETASAGGRNNFFNCNREQNISRNEIPCCAATRNGSVDGYIHMFVLLLLLLFWWYDRVHFQHVD